jgi:hypothetical protein
MRQRPDLIVPIRDRRAQRRILTWKHIRWALLAMIILFVGVTVASDLRRTSTGDYGRLFGKQIPGQPEVVTRTVDVVREAPVPDQTAADPLLVAPAAREQYLGVTDSAPQPAVSEANVTPPLQGHAATIIGGPEGVTIVHGEAPRKPVLSGGIFRQR